MKEEKKRLIAWVRAHKEQLLFAAGISIVALIGLIIGLKNREAVMALWRCLEKSIKKTPQKLPGKVKAERLAAVSTEVEDAVLKRSYTAPQMPFEVRQYVRTMSGGRHHSARKAAEAMAMGIELLPNQTLVDAYIKNAA